MTNEKKLELTLCGMFPYGLEAKLMCDVHEEFSLLETDDFVEIFKKDAIWKYCGFADKDLNIPLGEGEFNGWILRNNNTYADLENFCKPLLHSLDKLTEPILEGGLIPVVELFRMIFGSIGGYTMCYDKTKIVIEDSISEIIFYKPTLGYDALCFNISNLNEDGDNWNPPHNQLELFEKLKEWHFNLYGLDGGSYIEKSEV